MDNKDLIAAAIGLLLVTGLGSALVTKKIMLHNATPYGVVEEIVIPTQSKMMFDYFKADCKSMYPSGYVGIYMQCAHTRMKRFIKERDNADSN